MRIAVFVLATVVESLIRWESKLADINSDLMSVNPAVCISLAYFFCRWTKSKDLVSSDRGSLCPMALMTKLTGPAEFSLKCTVGSQSWLDGNFSVQ